jgi:hypothetical protein
MPELQARFKDSLCLPNQNAVTLMTVISVGNTLQQGIKFSHFVDLVNQEFKKGTIKKLIIVTTGYLQRHYFSLGLDKALDETEIEKEARELDEAWFKENEVYLKRLAYPPERQNWKTVLSLEPVSEFTQFLWTLNKHYQENKSFKKAITKHTSGYVSRKIKNYFNETGRQVEIDAFKKVAINYILEELAAFVQLKKFGADVFTYPGSMNPPACYLVKHFPSETSLKYIVYEVQECEAKKKCEEKKPAPLFFQPQFQSQPQQALTQHVQCLLEQVNWNTAQKIKFTRGFNQLLASINALTKQNEPLSSISKIITRRASL